MQQPPVLTGVHHVSALTRDIRVNREFYTRVLGLRLVKKTVNQDDTRMYHLFYADEVGAPGTDMTFFDFPHLAREHKGTDAITRTTFRVSGKDALEFWAGRLSARGIPHGGVTLRDGRRHLDFEDPDGTPLSLVDDGGRGENGVPRSRSEIPADWQVRGLGYGGITVSDLAPTDLFLREGLGLRHARFYPTPEGHTSHVYEMGEGGAHAELHVTERRDLPRTKPGAGGVHHIALRVPDLSQMQMWLDHLAGAGYHNSGLVERHYFKSIYVRDPNGVMIELATDGPGFGVDESPETLGEALALPPSLERQRASILARLRPLD